jgi:hypothetical protein
MGCKNKNKSDADLIDNQKEQNDEKEKEGSLDCETLEDICPYPSLLKSSIFSKRVFSPRELPKTCHPPPRTSLYSPPSDTVLCTSELSTLSPMPTPFLLSEALPKNCPAPTSPAVSSLMVLHTRYSDQVQPD